MCGVTLHLKTGLFCPDFKWHSKSEPLDHRTHCNHYKSGLVRYSDGNWIWKRLAIFPENKYSKMLFPHTYNLTKVSSFHFPENERQKYFFSISQIYNFPTTDETVAEVNRSMNEHLPFAVVGSSEFVKVGSKMTRARQYPWGVVQGKDSRSIWFVQRNWGHIKFKFYHLC